jgi:molecular chaperone GrpE
MDFFRSKNNPAANPADPAAPGNPGAPDGTDVPGQPSEPDATADLIDSLNSELAIVKDQLAAAAAERDELGRKYQAALAEMTNAARRARQSEDQARDMGIRSVLLNVLPVIDHFDYALNQDPAKVTAQAVVQGVTMIKEELIRALATQGAGAINPQPNDAFDPMQHEAVIQQPAEGVNPGHIVKTLRMGFTLSGRTVRPAQVIVAPQG